MSKTSKRILVTLAGAACWGISGTCTQYLCSVQGVNSVWLTQVRLIFAGLILVCFGFLTERERFREFTHTPRDFCYCIAFGVCGLMFTQYAYTTSISKTNSGTATVLQYFSVVIVLVVSCIMARKRPVLREILGIFSSIIGIFLVTTHGSFSSLYISREGFVWGMLSALAAAIYIMMPQKLMKKWGSILPIGWGMFFGGIAFFFLMRVWRIPMSFDREIVLGLIFIILVGTVCAFVLFLMGTTMIGAARGNMIGCVEPLVATLTSAAVLHTVFMPVDILGFVFILATVFVLAKK
ncbi:MAG: DMT family transporter [Clostridiales bacterium]|nr:DMT family transporter [Clostridiales bacterium]